MQVGIINGTNGCKQGHEWAQAGTSKGTSGYKQGFKQGCNQLCQWTQERTQLGASKV